MLKLQAVIGLCPLQASNSQINQTFTLPSRMFNAPAIAGGYLYIQASSSPVQAYQACPECDSTASG